MAGQPTLWITGTGGFLGAYMAQAALKQWAGWKVVCLSHAILDLTDFHAVDAAFAAATPQAIIHCAALSKTTDCERRPDAARRVNVDATWHLAQQAEAIPFLYLSTDLVFDGRTGNYDESAPVNPLHVYGETKAEAERLVLQNPRHFVVRTSLNAGTSGPGDRSFSESLRHQWEQGQESVLFTDEYRTPIAAIETARGICALFAMGSPGLYHLAGSERLSRFDIGQLLARQWAHLRPRIRAASLKEYTGPARAADTSLNCMKAQAWLPFRLPRFSDWLTSHPDMP